MRMLLALDRPRDERGATTVIFALMALVLLGAGAVAVDLGQVYAKRSSLQSAVDHAVLAAAAELDGSNVCTQGATDAATAYLQENWIDGSGDPIQVELLTGPGDNDGYIKCTGWHVELWAPTATVNFGLARAVSDVVGVEVPAYAAAGVFSPGTSVMPAFAVNGCDYGPQTLLDDSPGHTTPLPTPALPEDGTPDTSLTLDAHSATAPNPDPYQIQQWADFSGTLAMSLKGSSLSSVNKVAFSTPSTGSNWHYEVAVGTVTNTQVSISNIPREVREQQTIWYARVSRDGGTTWSKDAVRLQVGEALLECQSSVHDGNFGALRLPRAVPNTPSAWLPRNIASGLEYGVTSFPNPTSDWTCTPTDVGAVVPMNDGTNCVGTETGLPASATQAGLLTGEGLSVPARLAKPTNPKCGSDQRLVIGNSEIVFNNDRLTCFLAAGADDSYQKKTYTGPAVLSEDIFESPRFMWVPVFQTQADVGSSKMYQIVTFRPAFLTGTDDHSNNQYNGLGFSKQGAIKHTLRSVKVVFFNENALPDSISGGPVVDYLGIGTKVIVLVD